MTTKLGVFTVMDSPESFLELYQDKKLKSHADFEKHIDNKIKAQIEFLRINGKGEDLKLNASKTLHFLLNVLQIRLLKSTDDCGQSLSVPYIKDYDNSNGLLYKPLNIDEWINHLATYDEIIFTNNLDNIKKTINSQLATLKVDLYKANHPGIDIDYLNLAPKHIILLDNAVIDIKNHTIKHDLSDYTEYQFIHKTSVPLVFRDQLNETLKFYDTVFKRVMDDWSSNDIENLIFLYQLLFSSFDGNGRESYIFLEGTGGNGKSAFLNICQYLAGKQYTVRLNIDQLDDDGALKPLNESIKLVVGHEAPTDTKISKKTISRFKQLATGEGFQIPVKYKDNQICLCFGLKIQNTNTEISIFENSTAIKRRLISFPWTNVNFSKLTKDDLGFNLDELIGTDRLPGNPDFYSVVLLNLLENYTDFESFTVPTSASTKTKEMLDNADQVYMFFKELVEQDLVPFKVQPLNDLYERYKYWSKLNGSKTMKMIPFSRRLIKVAEEFGYTMSDKRSSIKSLEKNNDFNFKAINELFYNDGLRVSENNRSALLINSNPKITDETYKVFKAEIQDPEFHDNKKELTDCELIMFKMLILKGNHFAQLLSDLYL